MAIKGRRRRQTIFDSFIIYKYIKTYFYTNGSGDRDSQAYDFCIEQTDLELENVAHEHQLN
jgi:hypothetical protein